MLKGILKWKRLLAVILTLAMLFTNNYGIIEALAEGEESLTNFSVDAKLIVNTGDDVVDAGEKFHYQVQYSATNQDSKYLGALLSFTLPEYVHLSTDSNGNYIVDGPDFSSITYNDTTKEYTIYFTSPLPMHATNTLTIDMETKNLVTPDQLELDFSEGFIFQVQIQVDGKTQFVEKEVNAGKIRTNAKSD